MKKILKSFVVMLLALSLVGCQSKAPATTESSTTQPEGEKTVKVALLLPYIGDQSYFDIVYAGFQEIGQLPNVETKLIEMGKDTSKWENYYLEAAEGGYDLIIGGNWEAEAALYKIAKEFPDQKFINFDYSSPEELPNVYAMAYKCEELGFLAGIVAGTATKTNQIGAIGGMDTPSINDFFGGYIVGALAANPEVKVSFGYVGNFQDAPKAKEQADNMYKTGADVIFHAAGGAGNGLFESASGLTDKWAIGVDSNQALSFSEKPEIAKVILSSATKNCDAALVRAFNMYLEGTLPFGQSELLGYTEGGVGIVKDDTYNNYFTTEQKALIDSLESDLKNGKFEIPVIRLEENNTKWDELKASVQ